MDQLDRNTLPGPVVNELVLVVQLQHTRLVVDLDHELFNKLLADYALEGAARAWRKRPAKRQRHLDGL